jgi:ABC-type sulfate transport system substrate-binding protein
MACPTTQRPAHQTKTEFQIISHWPRLPAAKICEKGHGCELARELPFLSLKPSQVQEVIAQNFYRPIKSAALDNHARNLPDIELFSIQEPARDWDNAQQRFFPKGGAFESIVNSERK